MPNRTELQSILILSSGPIVIGQAAEFDYSGTQAVRASPPLRRAPELRRQLPQRIRPALQPFRQLHQAPRRGERMPVIHACSTGVARREGTKRVYRPANDRDPGPCASVPACNATTDARARLP